MLKYFVCASLFGLLVICGTLAARIDTLEDSATRLEQRCAYETTLFGIMKSESSGFIKLTEELRAELAKRKPPAAEPGWVGTVSQYTDTCSTTERCLKMRDWFAGKPDSVLVTWKPDGSVVFLADPQVRVTADVVLKGTWPGDGR